ncbi:damage-inducible protein CinA [Pelobium manganitolerans]|uniref:CinA-like protein n=1 Tax=Pelobium manganitolerans TaxID=1842495 RepID=A0A419S3L5_9SPHI|nr:competence/damage-inducible protein A [Pelobium manganitolerans]RKD13878.1 damage-inducible protein CinA [Pelobium manganitolerans]
MQAELITIGDEILIGQIVDTNSAWMAVVLNEIGVKVKQISSVSDDEAHILAALADAETRADLVLITGGLGPTKDDITKKTLAKYFDCDEFVTHDESLKVVEQIFAKYNRPLLEVNRQQALVPKVCTPILNQVGTAPGMLFRKGTKLFISMPGVPHEMKHLMTASVLPLIKQQYQLPAIYHQTILTAGLGESFLAEKLTAIEERLPAYIKLAYLPKLGSVRLRLSTTLEASPVLMAELDAFADEIMATVPEACITKGDLPIEKVILDKMAQKGLTLSLAESCTGGEIAHQITQHAGSSKVFVGGGVTYSNSLKSKLLGVKQQTLESFGAVSEETVLEMAEGAVQNFGSDYAVAVSGIAGPDGGSEEKPVGTVWIAVANKHQAKAKRFTFGKHRIQNIERATMAAFTFLFHFLKEQED